MKIIAHAITNPADAQKALNAGVDFVEVDVSKRIIFLKFTTRHHGILGKFGIGQRLEPMLASDFKNKLVLDIKHARFSRNFAKKLIKLLKDFNVQHVPICGPEWEIVSEISNQYQLLPFYSLQEKGDWQKLKNLLPNLKKPKGLSIQYALINKSFLEKIRNVEQKLEVWAWTVNDLKEVKRLSKLKVDGIITDKWRQLSTINSKL